jgi:hypothetical protein
MTKCVICRKLIERHIGKTPDTDMHTECVWELSLGGRFVRQDGSIVVANQQCGLWRSGT